MPPTLRHPYEYLDRKSNCVKLNAFGIFPIFIRSVIDSNQVFFKTNFVKYTLNPNFSSIMGSENGIADVQYFCIYAENVKKYADVI